MEVSTPINVGVVLVAVALGTLVIWQWIRYRAASLRSETEQIPVVVAAREVAAGRAIGPEDMEIVPFPERWVPDDALVQGDLLLGKVSRDRMLPGALFRRERVVPEPRDDAYAVIARVRVARKRWLSGRRVAYRRFAEERRYAGS